MRVRRWCDSLPISFGHLAADAAAAEARVDGEVQDVQPVLVQLIDHEADDPLAGLGDHADAVALAEAAEEVLLVPGELEALLFDRQDLGHVAADHPADMHRQAAPGGPVHASRASMTPRATWSWRSPP